MIHSEFVPSNRLFYLPLPSTFYLDSAMPPKATTATVPPVNVDQYLKDANKKNQETEVGDGPEGNWETAVSYPFPLCALVVP
jgi:hypothetical protein